MAIGNEFKQTVEVTTSSQMMLHAIEHMNKNGSHIESLIHDLVVEWMGKYEDAKFARNWTERNAIYARNAHRKATRLAMEAYFMEDNQINGEGK